MDVKALYRAFSHQVFEQRDLGAVEKFVAPSYTAEDPSLDRGKGPAGMRAALETILGAFDDIRYEILHQVAEGDWVATRYRVSGTNTRPFQGLHAPGARITIAGMSMNRFVDGRVVEGHVLWDRAGAAEAFAKARR